ncbi:ubiquinone/menaquinone biosynthesis C-methylase UbiE [Deinobacterium chartae]|uniref:Ubiquinone/menaquinone biosynthesis C-methylase UbiE n=1 Tax=Deinobacterium chartae TaxID=521158 RepID=A0A841HY18_9DEIO|nr:methyltransferase domain-containing protein [Deinobacterium chartae]MBB6097544.1 ubiquinone/menaquinone biosynthesis C-methylase UbiE [Deinobacterium chartae]
MAYDTSLSSANTEYLNFVAKQIMPLKRRSLEVLRLAPGDTALDVGCGPGIDTLALAREVGPGGQVLGIDASEAAVQQANRAAEQQGCSAWTRHRVGRAEQLPCADASVDAARAERLLQHLSDPAAAIAELRRVLRPGGRVALIDTDYASCSLNTRRPELQRRILEGFGQMFASPSAARRMPGWLDTDGWHDVQLEVHAFGTRSFEVARTALHLEELAAQAARSGTASSEEAQAWLQDLEEQARQRHFFASVTLVLVWAERA